MTEQYYGKIHAKKGKWLGGKDVYIAGYSLRKQLFGQISYMQLQILNVTGRLVDANIAAWLEQNFIGMSYPDSRIWCNQVAALCGANHTSVVSAAAAAVLAADSRAYGGSKSSLIGAKFLVEANIKRQQGFNLEQICQAAPMKNGIPQIVGFARPVAREDERLAAYQQLAKQYNLAQGEYLALANGLHDYLQSFGLAMNAGGYSCALLLDQGFSPEELYQIKAMVVTSGAVACYLQQLSEPVDGFLPIKVKDIIYQGSKTRQIPENWLK